MADIRSIDIRKGNIVVNLKISKDEYDLLNQETRDLLLLPAHSNILDRPLTTGKLGNSNRIMLPKKILDRHEITDLEKKVPAKTFNINDEVFLLIKLKRSNFGIPVFREVR
ncbi:MAG: hypothetical protein GTN38_01690 [Candidatus Aenigmarchaeota archaeon]|nr:hypothetical protein [Candidatus Aenigmarchaeota archaeon]NIQ17292.1 hypothetical protein [Candidatus Aenigmarchaeota archaeon]NIS73153.1 hypothetical protein [Candidatus Aenigmarchaeota archaeon]